MQLVDERPNVELRRPLRTAVYKAPDADAMRGLGRSIAGQLAQGVSGHREHEREDPQRDDQADRDRREDAAEDEPQHF